MAGLYADVPGHRFPYDVDGTVCLTSANGGTYNSWDPALLNDEATADSIAVFAYREQGTKVYSFCFPEPRDLSGYYVLIGSNANIYQYTTSTDTTDGSNGTWSAATNFTVQTSLYPQSRSAIGTMSVTNVKGVRFSFTCNQDYVAMTLQALHLYGAISPSQNIERLEFWHPTLDQLADKATFDFGDIAQGQILTKQFRLKNLSTTKTAGSVAISANNSAGGETLLAAGLTFSSDNASFATSLNIGSIAPGAITPVLYARRTVGASDPASIRFARIVASPGTFA